MNKRNILLDMCVVVVLLLSRTVLADEPQVDLDKEAQKSSAESNDFARLKDIQNKFLDAVGNSSSGVRSLREVINLLHTESGREMSRLFMEGFMLGFQQKDSGVLLQQFWTDLQERLSPELLESFDDYKDFFAGVDLRTVPLMWKQIFQKDQLGNSLAGLPLGQLVDMLQPTASRYGIDIRAMMSSLMGQSENNVRDLLFEAINNLDVPSLMAKFLNSSALQNSGKEINDEAKPKKDDMKTLRLFRPLVVSLIRENNLDLDADAVLEVMSPLLSGEVVAQAAPLIAMITSQAGELAPLVSSFFGGGQGEQRQQQMGGILGGIGALLAGGNGGKGKMDIASMISLASMFSGGSKVSNKKGKTKDSKKKEKKGVGLDLASLASLAGQMAENNNIDMGTVLQVANKFLAPEKKEKHTATKETNTERPEIKETNDKRRENARANIKSPQKQSKNLINVIEPLLLSMKTDEKCTRKIQDAIKFGKMIVNKKVSNLGDLGQTVKYLLSIVTGGQQLKSRGLNMDEMIASMTQAFVHADWNEFLENLENEHFRAKLILGVTPHATELVTLLSSLEVQEALYNALTPRLQILLTSYGLQGVTLHNFPERLAPLIGFLAKNWELPFNPTIILVPLRDYIRGLYAWAVTGLAAVREMTHSEVEQRVHEVLSQEVSEGVVTALKVTRNTDIQCLPQRLCHINSGHSADSLRASVTRVASLIFASNPVLETSDTNLLVKAIQAISGSSKPCEEAFPGDCRSTESDDDFNRMTLLFDHQEL